MTIPDALKAGLALHGWEFIESNEHYAFFERGGYCLRLTSPFGQLMASVLPERYHIPRPGRAPFIPRTPENMPPIIQGKQARARGRELACQLWQEHAPQLSALGVQLDAVGVLMFKGTGSGGHVTSRVFRREECTS